jgi:dienelactone hydrolase
MAAPEIVHLPLRLEVLRPKTEGPGTEGPGTEEPVPTVLLLHGCGGVQPMIRRYARTLQAAGVAAVIIDSFAHRGIGRVAAQLTVCTGLQLRGRERAGDLTEALTWLEGQPWVDPARITAAGWSHGGWTIMDALALAGNDPGAPPRPGQLARVLLVYPYCGPPALSGSRGWGAAAPPVTAIVCGRDQVVGSRAPLRVLARLAADGVEVSTHLFEDATHSFDDDAASDPRTNYRADLEAEVAARLVAMARPSRRAPPSSG